MNAATSWLSLLIVNHAQHELATLACSAAHDVGEKFCHIIDVAVFLVSADRVEK